MGVAPVISYNYGLGDRARLKKIFRICISFVFIVSASVFLLSMILGTPLVSIFSSRDTPVYDIARKGFLIFPFGFLFCGINIFTSAFFTALSDGKVSAVISSLRTFVFIICFLLVLPRFLQEMGVWLAIPLSELATMIVSVVFLLTKREETIE